ncbi:BTAD domain-containing putative transcriptional regulator [Herbiconiux daphne]|uniref:AAA family ATPase n=1 Tax=Herbiconiux daphne TaxID=2970914 RepID=A0ABT2H452_9MICO|nr:BTAD domain-containing putative transcriptional regulator [Herbiconiux daphne]MCS5734698.1 AAA family ATPase [Herbiconiux daphne]
MRYRLLGPLEVESGESMLELGAPKQRAVLGVLLVERGAVVSVDAIVDAVWGDEPPTSVAASLQAYVSNLRRVLRDESTAASPLVRRAPGYLLDVPAADVDRDVFLGLVSTVRDATAAGAWHEVVQAARSALSLWRGPVLADFADDDWARAERDRLEPLRLECREHLVAGLLALGQPTAALAVADEVVRADALRERGVWLRMLSLYRVGRSLDALELYRTHAEALDDELGLEPAAAVRELHTALLRQESWLDRWPRRESQPSPSPAPADAPDAAAAAPGRASAGHPDDPGHGDDPRGADPLGEAGGPADGPGGANPPTDTAPRSTGAHGSSTPAAAPPEHPGPRAGAPGTAGGSDFVGREGELHAMGSVLDTLASTRWLVLTGPAGIGKTRLAEEAIAAGWHGRRVVRTSCPEDAGTPPWWPVRAIVRSLGADPDAVLTPPHGVDADAARFAVYERLDLLLREAAQHGLAVLVDDVQWADSSTFRWLTHVASSVHDIPLAFVTTVRSGVDSPELDKLLATLARHQGARQLTVPPLAVGEIATLAGRVSGDEVGAAEALELSGQTGGNPFLVAEYARVPREERATAGVPVAVSSVLGRRLAAVDADVLQVLRTAAVAGDPLDIDLLCTVTRLSRDELADLLDEAADEQLIVLAPGSATYIFAHGLLRDEVLAGLSAPRRQRLHARIADALRQSGDDWVARRAVNLVAAHPFVAAADVLDGCRDAALDAEERWNSEAAADWWGRALQAWEWLPTADRSESVRDDLLVARVAALARAGRRQTVLDVVDEALLDAMREGRTNSAGRLASTLLRTAGSWPWIYSDHPERLLARLAGIEPLVATDAAAHVRVLAALAVGSYYEIDAEVPDRLSRRAIEIAERLGDPDALADALLGRALAFTAVPSHRTEQLELVGRPRALPHTTGRIDEVIGTALLHLCYAMVGDRDRVEQLIRDGTTGSDALRLPVTRMQMRWSEGELALWSGDLDRAEALYDLAIQLQIQTEMYTSGVYDIAMLLLRWEQGRLDEVNAMPEDNAAALPWAVAALTFADDPDEADRLLGEVLARPTGEFWTTLGEMAFLAHQMADARRPRHAEALAARLEPFEGFIAIFGQIGGAGPVSLALARLDALLGRRDDARRRVAAARALAESNGGRCALLRCRLLEAELDQAAASVYDEIAHDATRLGMHGVARQAREAADRADEAAERNLGRR